MHEYIWERIYIFLVNHMIHGKFYLQLEALELGTKQFEARIKLIKIIICRFFPNWCFVTRYKQLFFYFICIKFIVKIFWSNFFFRKQILKDASHNMADSCLRSSLCSSRTLIINWPVIFNRVTFQLVMMDSVKSMVVQ